MENTQSNSANPRMDLNFRRKKNAEDMKFQVIAFALTIFLTLVAFVAVGYDGFSHWFIVPFILLLAVVQVGFQLYYFMHMSHKGHEAVAFFLYSGSLVGAITILTFVTIVWL
ncbi:cytochrome c oxidase subunit IVB [Peribacillus saganii]|uniref:Cytochrome c oxidase subunit IVB n=1 Tax=Peribacillus saganii TaxID=2303992 RepID=A0A372LUG1_9BACI|nr:cytochrome c oxidase subunit IVB [Peribacillus saganii]RFU71204.1 cytochrome c oxidase subunit IVB [Peribacillus saganii]